MLSNKETNQSIRVRGRLIDQDSGNLVCLNDIWRAAGYSKNQKPEDWVRLGYVSKLVEAVLVRVTGKTQNWSRDDYHSVWYMSRGQGRGIYADVRIALAYAEYLNPKLAIEVREVFIRFKAADVTLADEILERGTADENEWAGRRAMGRTARKRYTATLQEHGVRGPGYGRCTNAIYVGLFGEDANGLKAARGVPKTGSLRDHMDTSELTYTMASESLASERIEEENCWGTKECADASQRSATFIHEAIEKDRADRSKRRLEL